MTRILFFAAFLFVNTTWAQQFHFSGNISGLADENINVQYPADWFGNALNDEVSVVSNFFSKKLQLPVSGWINVSYKDKDRAFYLWRGASNLSINFEADFLDDTITVSGNGASIHEFVSLVKENFGSKLSVKWLEEQAEDATNIDAMEMDAFRLRNDVIYSLKNFEKELPESFIKAYKNHIGYYYYLSLFKFSAVKTSRSNIPKATEIPKVLLEGLDWERMNRATELDSKFFRELLLQYVNYKALEAYDFMKFSDKESAVQESFNLTREHLKGESAQYFITQTMLLSAENIQPSLLRKMRDYLKGVEDSDDFVKLIEDSLSERLLAKDDEVEVAISDTQQKHDQIDVEIMGEDGKTFKLSDLHGKVVYLDIWASWCGPCRKQFPAAKELKSKLSKKERKNIAFLYISIDNTETVWKKAIKELGIEGIHGLSKGGWSSEVTAKFGVSSIPRYLIFDKKGKVVDGNAPRPTDPRLLEILKKLASQ